MTEVPVTEAVTKNVRGVKRVAYACPSRVPAACVPGQQPEHEEGDGDSACASVELDHDLDGIIVPMATKVLDFRPVLYSGVTSPGADPKIQVPTIGFDKLWISPQSEFNFALIEAPDNKTFQLGMGEAIDVSQYQYVNIIRPFYNPLVSPSGLGAILYFNPVGPATTAILPGTQESEYISLIGKLTTTGVATTDVPTASGRPNLRLVMATNDEVFVPTGRLAPVGVHCDVELTGSGFNNVLLGIVWTGGRKRAHVELSISADTANANTARVVAITPWQMMPKTVTEANNNDCFGTVIASFLVDNVNRLSVDLNLTGLEGYLAVLIDTNLNDEIEGELSIAAEDNQ